MEVFTNDKLNMLFSYHAPTEKMQEGLIETRAKARELADVIVKHTANGRDQAAAIEHLRAAVMFANASIVLSGN